MKTTLDTSALPVPRSEFAMSDSFDPYHKWLGIPPRDQPPTHYRLLGIELFEDDRDVIDSAANQRMTYLQDLATGPQVEISQRLLNEISAARRCLLNRDAKAAYDRDLRAKTATSPAKQVAAAQPAAVALPQENRQFDFLNAPADSSGRSATVPSTPRAHSSRNNPLLIQAGVAVAALAVIVGILLSRGNSESAGDQAERANFQPTIKTGLVLDWPAEDRTGAMVIIDGEKRELGTGRFLEFSLPPGEHRAIIVREGYDMNQLDIRLDQGKVARYRLDWKRSVVQ